MSVGSSPPNYSSPLTVRIHFHTGARCGLKAIRYVTFHVAFEIGAALLRYKKHAFFKAYFPCRKRIVHPPHSISSFSSHVSTFPVLHYNCSASHYPKTDLSKLNLYNPLAGFAILNNLTHAFMKGLLLK